MRHVFQNGDSITVSSCNWPELTIGDIVVFKRENEARSVIHRIVGRSDRQLITQGDHNPAPDSETVSPDQLIGLAVSFSRASKQYSIRRGSQGAREFRKHQFLLKLRRTIQTLCRPLCGTAPLAFLKFLLPPLKKHVFGEWEFLYCGRKLVAQKKHDSHEWLFTTVAGRCFFSRSDLQNFVCSSKRKTLPQKHRTLWKEK